MMNDVYDLMQRGDFTAALQAIKGTPEDARDYRSYYSEGKVHLALGDYQSARACFDEASQRRAAPFLDLAVEERAIAWFLQGEVKQAISIMEKHLADLASGRVTYSSDTFGLGPKFLLVALLVLSGRADEARRLIGTLLDASEGSSAWPVPIARFLQGSLSEEALLDASVIGSDGAPMSGRAASRGLCRAEFYVGVMRALAGMPRDASEMFRRAAARNVTVEPEWFLAQGLARGEPSPSARR